MSAPRSHPTGRLLAGVLSAVSLLSAAAVTVAPAHAAPPVAAGVRAGTTGLGAEVAVGLSERAHLRVAAGRYAFDTTISTPDLDYDTEAEVAAALLLLDWYPGAGAFRLSVGAGWNGTEADVSAPIEDLLRTELPSLPPLAVDFGTVSGTASGDELVPVVLLGWGNPFRGGRWNVSFEIGAFYQGEPDVDLRLETDALIDEAPGVRDLILVALGEEERALEEELDDYTVVPVVSLSVGYRF